MTICQGHVILHLHNNQEGGLKMSNSDELREKIRTFVGVDSSRKPWFTRKEIKQIVKYVLSKETTITDDYTEPNFVNAENLFPHYLEGIWQYQGTVNTSPNYTNLSSIYKMLCYQKSKSQEKEEGLTGSSNLEKYFHSKYQQATKSDNPDTQSVLKKIPDSLLNRAKEILITENNITISIKLQ